MSDPVLDYEIETIEYLVSEYDGSDNEDFRSSIDRVLFNLGTRQNSDGYWIYKDVLIRSLI